LQAGYDADFVIWDPLESFTVDETRILHKNRTVTPYMGRKLQARLQTAPSS
jgi:dihydroorotase-like cyclic amidohydrolase